MQTPDGEKRTEAPIHDFSTEIVRLWAKGWFPLTAGDFEKGDFNTMTVAWASVGYLRNRPYAEVFARPTRYTYEFPERYPTLTLTAFEERHREAPNLLGTK
jgi:hypothetical protein